MNNEVIDPKLLSIWIRSLRTCQSLSQDAVAAAGGIDVRSVQRAETGEKTSVQTRRSIARGLGYQNIEVFNDPQSTKIFVEFISELAQQQAAANINEMRTQNPDALELIASRASGARELCQLAAGCEGLSISIADGVSEAADELRATIADWLRDFGDCASDISQAQQLEFEKELTSLLAAMANEGVSTFCTSRKVRLANRNYPEMPPFDWTIAYVHFAISADENVHLFVHKQVSM